VQLGQIEETSILANNRSFAKVLPQATMEFDLPKRDILMKEAIDGALATYNDVGALINDPSFLALTKMYSGQPTSSVYGSNSIAPQVRDVLPGLPSQTDENLLIQSQNATPEFASQLEALIPDPAIYKFETGTGFEIRPVIQPDGQAVVFDFQYLYTTNVREPVRADEKHLGRVKRHFIDTEVQLGNYEMREISRYRVALKASRTSRGVPLFEDIPGLGILFRPLPSDESSLQQNIILGKATIFPTLFDLMGLRWAPAVADLDSLRLQEQEFVYRRRMQFLKNEVYDYSSDKVDEFMRIPEGERRPDLYREQETIPYYHPNGYYGPGLDRQDSHLQEGFDPEQVQPPTPYVPGATPGNVSPTQPRYSTPAYPPQMRPLPPGQTVPLRVVPPGAQSEPTEGPFLPAGDAVPPAPAVEEARPAINDGAEQSSAVPRHRSLRKVMAERDAQAVVERAVYHPSQPDDVFGSGQRQGIARAGFESPAPEEETGRVMMNMRTIPRALPKNREVLRSVPQIRKPTQPFIKKGVELRTNRSDSSTGRSNQSEFYQPTSSQAEKRFRWKIPFFGSKRR
jgi:hypothetical protein